MQEGLRLPVSEVLWSLLLPENTDLFVRSIRCQREWPYPTPLASPRNAWTLSMARAAGATVTWPQKSGDTPLSLGESQ